MEIYTMRALRILSICLITALIFGHFRIALIGADDSSGQKKCGDYHSEGYLFDNYERAEYVNNFLVLRLKLKPPYNDGRRWRQILYLYKPDCSYDAINLQSFSYRPTLQFYSIRFTSLTHAVFWDDEQDIPLQCSTCAFDIPAPGAGSAYTAIAYHGNIDGFISNIYTASHAISNKPQKILDPVLVVPGLLGTELTRSDELVWPNVQKMILSPDFLDWLDMDHTARPKHGVFPGKVLSKINYKFGDYHYTSLLIEELNKHGYIEGKNLFLFAYDWRLSVVDIRNGLKSKIDEILRVTGSKKLNIIAHSLGGLVLKQHLVNISANTSEEEKLNKLIFVGVPNLGTAEAAKALIFGTNLDIPLLDSDKLLALVQYMPSIYELLPSAEYFKHSAGFYDDLSDKKVKRILDYEQSKNMLIALGKNQGLLNNAEILHSKHADNFDFSSKKYAVYNIVGCGAFTLKTINKMYAGQQNIIKKLFNGPKYRIYGSSGDGTVLTFSAAYMKLSKNNTFYFKDIEHVKMLSAPGTRQLISALASGEQVPNHENLVSDPNSCNVKGHLLSLNSNIDFDIKDAATGNLIERKTVLQEKKFGNDLHLFFPANLKQKYQVNFKPKSKSVENIDFSLTQFEENKTVVNNYSQVAFTQQIILNLANNVHEARRDNGSAVEIINPSNSFNLPDSNQSVLLKTALKNANGHVALNGKLEIYEGNSKVYFEVNDKNYLAFIKYSLDDGQNWVILNPAQDYVEIPNDKSSIHYFSESKSGDQEDIQAVDFIWQGKKTQENKTTQNENKNRNNEADNNDSGKNGNNSKYEKPVDATDKTSKDYSATKRDKENNGHNSERDEGESSTEDFKRHNNIDDDTISTDLISTKDMQLTEGSFNNGPINITLQMPEPKIVYVAPQQPSFKNSETNPNELTKLTPQQDLGRYENLVVVDRSIGDFWKFVKNLWRSASYIKNLIFF